MAVRLKEMWNGIPAGNVIDPGAGVEELLLKRGIAERVEPAKDLDGDGRSEGGREGTAKAFTAPPTKPLGKKR